MKPARTEMTNLYQTTLATPHLLVFLQEISLFYFSMILKHKKAFSGQMTFSLLSEYSLCLDHILTLRKKRRSVRAGLKDARYAAISRNLE